MKAYTHDEYVALLAEAGFTNVESHADWTPALGHEDQLLAYTAVAG
jgi:hypothetical protein